MPHSFLLPNLYDGETLLSQCPFLSTYLHFTSSLKSPLSSSPWLSSPLISLSLSLWVSKPCLYYIMLSIYFGTHYFPIVFCVDWFFPNSRKTAPGSQPANKDQWLYPRGIIPLHYESMFSSPTLSTGIKDSRKEGNFYLQKSFQFLWERCYMHINSAFYDLSGNLPWNTVGINSKWDANSTHITVKMSQDWGFHYICSFPSITLPENLCSICGGCVLCRKCSVNN